MTIKNIYLLCLWKKSPPVDTKVITANLRQNQCLQCVPPPLTHAEIPQRRNATELNNDSMTKSGDVHYQTEPNLSTLSEGDLINNNSNFCSHILLIIDLRHIFPFRKLLLNVPPCL